MSKFFMSFEEFLKTDPLYEVKKLKRDRKEKIKKIRKALNEKKS